ncbi:MAG: metallophosphoesterase family protein [Pseudomonadota bacterium]
MKIAVIADIHANIYAFDAVIADIDNQNVEQILMLGDIIGYYYWPAQTIRAIRADPRFICIRGNHEDILSIFAKDEASRAAYREKYGSGYDVCLAELTTDELQWLADLPAQQLLEIGESSFFMRHGNLVSSDEYLYPDAPAEILESSHSDCDFTLFGHTHYPFLHAHKGSILINPGSVGQPRDAGGIASYAIINLDNRAVQFRRCRFETSEVITKAKSVDPDRKYLWRIMER